MSHVAPKSQLYAVFGALMVLTVVTVLVSRVNLGYMNLPVAMAVAAILGRKVTIDEAIEQLLTRPFRAEG